LKINQNISTRFNLFFLAVFIVSSVSVKAQYPTVYFNEVYAATYSTANVVLGTQVSGYNFRFVGNIIGTGGVFQATGGEILGKFIYISPTTGNNVIFDGKLNKVGAESSITYGFVFEEASPGTSKFFLTDPVRDAQVSQGDIIRTNSSQIADDLNAMRNSQTVLQTNYLVSNFTACLDNPSQPQTFTVSGSRLVANTNVTVTAPTNFQVSKTNAALSYSSSITFSTGSGTLAPSTVYLRLASQSSTGTYSGEVQVSANNAATQHWFASGDVYSNTAITVQPSPASPCTGTATTFSLSATGASLTYQWQVSTDNGSTYSSLTNSGIYTGVTTSVLRLSSGLTTAYNGYKYQCLVSGACGSTITSSSVLLTVKSPISITSQPSSSTICENSNTTFSVTAEGDSPTYQWWVSTNGGGNYTSISNTAPYSNATTTTLSLTAASSSYNNYKYKCVVTGTCSSGSSAVSSDAASLTINTAPAAPVSITGNSSLCSNTDQVYSVAAVSGATTYTWEIPSGWLGTSTTNIINVISSSNSGDIRVKAQNSCGESSFTTKAVTVSALASPSAAFTINNQEQCLSSNSFNFINGSSAATGTTISAYSWDFGDGVGTSALTSPTDYRYLTAGTYTVKLTVTASNSCVSTISKQVVINSAPTGSISGTTSICPGNSATLTVSLTGQGPWVLDYTDASSPISVTTSSSTISVSPTSNKTFYLTSLSDSKCPAISGGLSGSAVITVNSLVTPTVSISTTNSNICSTPVSTVTFTSSVTEGGSPPNYQWLKNGVAIPSDASSSSYSASSNTFADDDVISLQMLSTSTSCLSVNTVVSNSIQMTVHPGIPASPLAISGDTTQCTSLTNQSYSIIPVLNATSYTWSFPSGWTINSGDGTNSINVSLGASASSGSVSVTASNGCGTSTAQLLPVLVSNSSTNPFSSPANTTQTKCINTAISSITYTSSGGTGATYSGLPNGVTGDYSSGTVTLSGIPSVAGTFPYTVTLTGGGCDYTTTGTITVTPNNTISLSSATGTNVQTACINTPITDITYSTTGATGATYSGLPPNVTGNYSSGTVPLSGNPSVAGTYPYTVTLTGGCSTVTANGIITVTAAKTLNLSSTSSSNSQTLCVYSTLSTLTYNSTGGTGAVFSGLPSGVSGSYNSGAVSISGAPSVSGTFNYTVSITGGCGTATEPGTISTRQADEWTSNGNTEVFHTPSNWCKNSVPGASSNVVIPSVTSNKYPKLTGQDASVGSMEIRTDAKVNLNGRKLIINGTLSGAGELSGASGSTLEFAGSGSIGTLNMDQTSTDTKTIGTLKMNRLDQTLTMGTNAIVTNLDLTAGKIDLGDKELIISTAATNASASSYVKISGIGKVKKNISNGASFTFPVGNIAYNPITITNNNSSADDFTVNIVDEVYANYNSDGVGTTILTSPRVKRTWNIGKANANASSGINLTFNWNSGEVAGTINTPALYHFESGVWVKQTGTTSSPTSTSFTFTGYTGTFSPFSIGDANTNLPVSWLSFTATKQFNTVQLNWATASETNTRDFVVEYSNNAQQWTALTTVPAAGNSTTTRNYSYVHQNPLKGNNYNYYRILQRDIDDKFSYSKIVSIIFNEPGADLQVYPNPVQDQLTIFLAESQLVRLVNAAGATVWKGQLPAGRNTMPVHTYSTGVYVLTAGMQSQRVLIQ